MCPSLPKSFESLSSYGKYLALKFSKGTTKEEHLAPSFRTILCNGENHSSLKRNLNNNLCVPDTRQTENLLENQGICIGNGGKRRIFVFL